MAKLEILTGPKAGENYDLKDITILGRDLKSDVPIEDDLASRPHAKIEKTEDGFLLIDLNSRNGTFVDGHGVEREVLSDGCRITIGEWAARFLIEDDVLANVEADDKTSTSKVEKTVPADASFFLDKSLAPGAVEQIDTLRQRFNLLNEIREKLGSANTVSSLLDEATAHIINAYPRAQRCAIVFKDAESKRWASRSVKFAEDVKPHRIRVSRTIAEKVFEEGNAILSTDAQEDERFRDATSIEEQGIRSCMCAPLVTKSGPLGVVHLDTFQIKTRFNEDDLLLLVAIAGEVSLAVENLMLYRELLVAKERLEQENVDLKQQIKEKFSSEKVIGSSRAMVDVLSMAEKASEAANTPVLITGETGSGKELIVQSIHYNGARAQGPFVAINCAAVPEGLLESELFGYERGRTHRPMNPNQGYSSKPVVEPFSSMRLAICLLQCKPNYSVSYRLRTYADSEAKRKSKLIAESSLPQTKTWRKR